MQGYTNFNWVAWLFIPYTVIGVYHAHDFFCIFFIYIIYINSTDSLKSK